MSAVMGRGEKKGWFGERLLELVGMLNKSIMSCEKEFTVEYVCDCAEVDISLVKQCIYEGMEPDNEFKEKFVQAFGVNRDWMLFGRGMHPFETNLTGAYYTHDAMNLLLNDNELPSVSEYILAFGRQEGQVFAKIIRRTGQYCYELCPYNYPFFSEVGEGGRHQLIQLYRFLRHSDRIGKLNTMTYVISDFLEFCNGDIPPMAIRKFPTVSNFLFSFLGDNRFSGCYDYPYDISDLDRIVSVIKGGIQKADEINEEYDRELICRRLKGEGWPVLDGGGNADDEEVEEESIETKGEDESSLPEVQPRDVDIVPQTMVVSNIAERLKEGEIILDPDFQRSANIWDETKQSRLIESLIIGIPLPTFYFNDGVDEKYTVVDGLQRLYTIKRFMVLESDAPDCLELRHLEYLHEYDGMKYMDLPASIRRRIREQTIIAYVIRTGTPEFVKNSIFTRINTGGMQLTPAEIKNSVYRGPVADLLRRMGKSEEFVRATNHKVSPDRMLDREFANRFLAFYVLGTDSYRGNVEKHMNEVLMELKEETEEKRKEYEIAFRDAMSLATDIFGVYAFRRININGKYGKINKPLFDCVSVSFAKLSPEDRIELRKNRVVFFERYDRLLRQQDFQKMISSGTAKKSTIIGRDGCMMDIIKDTLGKEDD